MHDCYFARVYHCLRMEIPSTRLCRCHERYEY
jgi:hypothetical protein